MALYPENKLRHISFTSITIERIRENEETFPLLHHNFPSPLSQETDSPSMAPTWIHLARKPKPSFDADSAVGTHDQNSSEVDPQSLRGDRVGQLNEAISSTINNTGTSSSLCKNAPQYAHRQAPIGFEQFSPPPHRRRSTSHYPRLLKKREIRQFEQESDATLDVFYEKMELEDVADESKEGYYDDEKKKCDEEEVDKGKEDETPPKKEEEKSLRRLSAPHHRRSLHPTESKVSFRGIKEAVLSRLPHGGEEGVIYDRKKTVRTMITILGGWCALIVSCFGFKILSIKYEARAPDVLAEYVLNSPTATTQWFTFSGVLLGELALILWGHSISYMSFRRLAYGKERTELLTYAAWNEMSRAGYTLSRRRPLWPFFTLLIFIGNTFLPAGFSTLLTPKPMVVTVPYRGVELDELSDGFGAAIGFLPASTFPNPANLSCGSQYVSNFWTFASHPGTIFDPCPSLDDVQTLIMAGRGKLEASVNQPEPLFKLPSSITYVGGTGGISTLGVDGIIPFSTWARPPRHAPTPRGYNYTYTLDQQGLTVDVKCWQPTTPEEKNILTINMTEIAHLLQVTLKCNVGSTGQDVSYHYIGSSSIILMGCTSKNAQGQDDPDSTLMYFKDAGAEVYGSESELGGDLVCELKPKWTRNTVEYVSDRRWINVKTKEDEGPPNRLTGFQGELGPGNHSFSPTNEESKQQFFKYYTRLLTVQGPLAAVGNAFVYTSTLSSLINATLTNQTSSNSSDDPNAQSTLRPTLSHLIDESQLQDTVLFGKNSAVQSLAAFNARVNAQKVKTWIQPSQVEVFIKGVFEYAATSQREWFQHYAVDGGNFNGPIGIHNGTIPVNGVWVATTVGYGSSTENNDHFVYFSLVPLLAFALVSCGMIAWSQWYDAPRDYSPYAADIDPTDWVSQKWGGEQTGSAHSHHCLDQLEAVVAASKGGLRYAFAKDALQNSQGLQEARKVRVRLGQIIDPDDPNPIPRLGFVCVD